MHELIKWSKSFDTLSIGNYESTEAVQESLDLHSPTLTSIAINEYPAQHKRHCPPQILPDLSRFPRLVNLDISHRNMFATHPKVAAERLACERLSVINIVIDDDINDLQLVIECIEYIEKHDHWLHDFVRHHCEIKPNSNPRRLVVHLPLELWRETDPCPLGASRLQANPFLTTLNPKHLAIGIEFSW